MASDIKQSYQAAQTLTTTNLQSLGSSATAGWQSDVVDNTSNLFDDALVQVVVDFANTSPANNKAVYVYAYSGLETTYTNPCTGTEGTLTVPDITANPLSIKRIGTIPYTTQDEVAESQVFSVAAAFGGILPPKWGIAIMNYSGAALASSGNTAKYRGVYYTAS